MVYINNHKLVCHGSNLCGFSVKSEMILKTQPMKLQNLLLKKSCIRETFKSNVKCISYTFILVHVKLTNI